MANEKYYPGPWQHEYDEQAEEHRIFIPADIGVYEIATIGAGFSEEIDAQIEANANLISAAPELLESLEMCAPLEGRHFLETIEKYAGTSAANTPEYHKILARHKFVQDAIGKAKGEVNK